ncbi:MAG: hypothetical protein M9920_16090 [Verrucomicrobiae bacterium]|nr:hypothetical protein [Verrucomicrobiae bacterium]
MKNLILILALAVSGVGCVTRSGVFPSEVSFEWFNLSTNEIWVVQVVGLPEEASCGRLVPTQSEDSLKRATSTFLDAVRIKNQLTIIWKEKLKEPFTFNPGEIAPKQGIMHSVELKRDDLGIPSRMTRGKIRFTYLGNDKWRIKLLKS